MGATTAAAFTLLFSNNFPPSDYERRHMSKIDPDNPPPEVREAAADMGWSVHEYKRIYLDRPSICESANRLYKRCVRDYTARNPKADTSDCQGYIAMREAFKCDKYEQKYLDPNQDGWLVKFLTKNYT